METIFFEISIVLLIVLVISFIMRILKQPLIIGYILSGILVGPFLFNLMPDVKTLQTFSEFGIAFLLFIVGLHLSPKVIKEVGKISLITGLGQVIFTSVLGYFICLAFGFQKITSIYISIALTFSSTIIIMKLLSDKDALDTLYGKISVGFLLVQDLVAIVILIVVSALSSGGEISSILIGIFIKGVILFIVLFPFSYFILPKMNSFFAKSQEVLFIFAISWGLGLSALFSYIGFSVEVGALIAGILLSISPYNYEISSRLKPLRDFFIISFFILLGSQMAFGDITHLIIPAIVLSLFVLIGNPLIVIFLMGIFGYSKRTGFMAGLTVAQISEFSLVLITLGWKVGHLSTEILSFVTLIGLITIAGSTYMIMYSEKLYGIISPMLSFFERKRVKEESEIKPEYEYVLFGENRIGFSIMETFYKQKKNKCLVVDFNPLRVKRLCKLGLKCIYGDASDPDFLEEIRVNKSKLVVSTISEIDINLFLIKKIRDRNKDCVILVTAKQIREAKTLYSAGADYVILPHLLGGKYVANLIENAKENREMYRKEKETQFKEFEQRLKEDGYFG